MKNIEIRKCNLNQLIEEKLVLGFSLPLYQREYSWEKKNWEEFLKSIEEIAENNEKEQEKPNIWFIGDIILQKKLDNDIVHFDIIDGQQRLITIFLLLAIIYQKNPINKEEETKKIRNKISEFY